MSVPQVSGLSSTENRCGVFLSPHHKSPLFRNGCISSSSRGVLAGRGIDCLVQNYPETTWSKHDLDVDIKPFSPGGLNLKGKKKNIKMGMLSGKKH